MRCHKCKKQMKKKKARYHYKECGLDNVYLDGVNIYYCSCGEEAAGIPCVEELHKLLMKKIADESARLTGPEIRFIRKNLGIRAKDFARLLNVSKVTVSRWENDKVKIDKAYDNIIRGLVKCKEFRAVLESINGRDQGKQRKKHRYVLDQEALQSCAL